MHDRQMAMAYNVGSVAPWQLIVFIWYWNCLEGTTCTAWFTTEPLEFEVVLILLAFRGVLIILKPINKYLKNLIYWLKVLVLSEILSIVVCLVTWVKLVIPGVSKVS